MATTTHYDCDLNPDGAIRVKPEGYKAKRSKVEAGMLIAVPSGVGIRLLRVLRVNKVSLTCIIANERGDPIEIAERERITNKEMIVVTKLNIYYPPGHSALATEEEENPANP